MAISFREWPWPVQVLIYAALAVVIIVVGEYAPAPFPLKARGQELADKKEQESKLKQEVSNLQNFERRHAELKAQMEASQKQLAILQEVVPENKEVDQFILQVQEAATLANVSIRRMTAKPIVSREFHYEMPFEMEIDGPYYNIEDFFKRLSGMSRIINVSDLAFNGLGESLKYKMSPGSTVTGNFTIVTFFTQGGPKAAPASAKQPGGR
jgi:type IV pilus assembly protein PilO